jgi:ATP-dependent Lon protease
MENNMIKPTEKLSLSKFMSGINSKYKSNNLQDPKENISTSSPNGFINILDLLNGRKNKQIPNTSNIDIKTLPEDIRKHIEEKQEELNNNMMINGKAKEYIDNLLKIPFGKFREEKIFKFIPSLITKLNTCLEPNTKLFNESDIIKFFSNQSDLYAKYYPIYRKFTEFRIKYLEYVDNTLDSTIYGHTSTKKQLKCIIAQWLSGGFNKGIVLGIQGPPGVGKTSLIKGALSKCIVDFIDYNLETEEPVINLIENTNHLGRPFCFISLGGSTNSSTLNGHNITYHGSTSGDIVTSLKEAKCMNPIIYFDELDKISKTESGYEISSVLTHITDPAQNEHFVDRYFSEVKIDLSKCIIVFSYNDSGKIDRILLDRIQEINLQAIILQEKIEISKKFLIPEILKNIGYNLIDINIPDNVLENIVLEYTFEAGVRKLKEKLEEVIQNIHLTNITNNSNELINTTISSDNVDLILNESAKVHLRKITNINNKIGCIYGMYATANGLGDILPIQVKKTYSKDILGLQVTGSLEKVISESMEVAKTVGWNLLTTVEQTTLITSYANTGLHIHCPDGSTSKDGPSAGVAITTAIYSLFINKGIRQDVAITGEIDLDGNITAIGGLNAKLSGAKRAGITIALIPEQNKRDIDILLSKQPNLLDDSFSIKYVNHICQVIEILF